jgi:hypothetical protein
MERFLHRFSAFVKRLSRTKTEPHPAVTLRIGETMKAASKKSSGSVAWPYLVMSLLLTAVIVHADANSRVEVVDRFAAQSLAPALAAAPATPALLARAY